MGILDLFPHTQDEAQATAQPVQQLPATFGETFEAAWNNGRLFSQSIAHGNAQKAAFDDYLDEVKRATGEDIRAKVYSNVNPLATAQEEVRRIKVDPRFANVADIDEDSLERRTIQKARDAQRADVEMGARDKTMGGVLGGFLGSTASTVADPMNIVAMVFAPEAEAGVLISALKWGALAGAGEAGSQILGAPFHEKVQPGFIESGAPLASIAETALFGGVAGGAFKALGNTWTRVKTGAWPRSVRDAGNVIESEANIQNSNVWKGTPGEVAHRKALLTALDQVLAEEPVNILHIITPEIENASRSIITRLEGEAGMALPIFDERAVSLLSEQAQLRERDSLLQTERGNIPEGDPAAAEKLARLTQIESEMAQAQGPERRALAQRRDELLTDTTPERLREAARPVELARANEAERDSIRVRLTQIESQQAAIDAEARLSPAGRQMLGQRMPARLVPFERVRLAAQEGAAGAGEALGNSIKQIAREGGTELDEDEVRALLKQFAKLTPEQADDAAKNLRVSARSMAAVAKSGASKAADEVSQPVAPARLETLAKVMDTPEQQAAVRTQLETAGEPGKTVVYDVDEKGNPVEVSLGKILREIDDDRAAADQIEACVTPAPEPAGDNT